MSGERYRGTVNEEELPPFVRENIGIAMRKAQGIVAARGYPRGWTEEDLYQHILLTLWRCSGGYDGNVSRPSTYAAQAEVNNLLREFNQQYGDALGMAASLDEQVGEMRPLRERVADARAIIPGSELGTVDEIELEQALEGITPFMLSLLPKRQAGVLRMRAGLDTEQYSSLEIAAMGGMTPNKVRLEYSKARFFANALFSQEWLSRRTQDIFLGKRNRVNENFKGDIASIAALLCHFNLEPRYEDRIPENFRQATTYAMERIDDSPKTVLYEYYRLGNSVREIEARLPVTRGRIDQWHQTGLQQVTEGRSFYHFAGTIGHEEMNLALHDMPDLYRDIFERSFGLVNGKIAATPQNRSLIKDDLRLNSNLYARYLKAAVGGFVESFARLQGISREEVLTQTGLQL